VTGGPLVGVLALQGDVREHVHALERSGARAVPVRRPRELEQVEALVIPGGESTTMAKLAAVFGVLEPLRERVHAGLPTYGSCAGMIMLADKVVDGIDGQETIGGLDVLVRRNAFGRQVDSFEGPVEFAGLEGPPLHGVFIRAPWVEASGAGVEVLARISSGPAAGRIVAVRQDNLLATSFHPELTGDDRVHRFFVSLVREAVAAGQVTTTVSSEEQG
jgi:pyridoxal 5'-phosphate synthase pdxT subunit